MKTAHLKQRHLLSDSATKVVLTNDDNFIDSEDELEMTVAMKASNYVKRGLYYVTDIERFQPPRKRPKLAEFSFLSFFFAVVSILSFISVI